MAAADIRDLFDRTPSGTVGLEEEVMLLDPETSLPVPMGPDVVGAASAPGVKVELPAAQVELLTAPRATSADALYELAAARRLLVRTCGDGARPAALAAHPTATSEAVLTPGDRYHALADRHRSAIRRQLVGSLQVHVAVGGADRTLAVYNGLRGHLPALAALAAAAPFHEGRDTGLASVRPLICTMLPRQGVPPAIDSWESFADDIEWGCRSETMVDSSRWWWEVRPHLVHGTLELRVPDAQPSLDGARGVVALARALVLALAHRHDEGRVLPVPATWRIAENRWAALRDGVEGEQADLFSGEVEPTRRLLHRLIDEAEPFADQDLALTRRLVERNAAMEMRAVGLDATPRWAVDAFDA